MNEYEYQTITKKIKRKNRIIYCAIMSGLASLVIGTKMYISNPDISYGQKEKKRKNLKC